MGPLQGVKVLDLTRVLAGPYCTMMLADFGADVYKIETPGVGDDSRAFGPFIGKESAYYMSLNRNKRSMCMNMKDEKHKAVFIEMVKKADVVVENYRPGTMEKFGLGYDVLKEINPGIIYVECSGFGRTGPYRLKPAYDVVVQAMGGIMSITGAEGGEPTRVGASIGDVAAGLFSVIGCLMALYHKQKTGEGQLVDVAMLDCQVAMLENAIARYYTTGESPAPIGNRHPSITPFAAFPAKDGNVIIGCGNQKLWVGMCELFGKPEWIDDPRFATNGDRTNNVKELMALMNEVTVTKTVDEWLPLLEAKGLPCAPINDMARITKDPSILEREMLVELEHPIAGKMTVPGCPIKMSATPGSIRKHAPLLGADINEMLDDLLGWDEATVKEKMGL